jgi:hypothetical protein
MGMTKKILICLLVFGGELIILSIMFKDVKLPAVTMLTAGLAVLFLTLGFTVKVHRLKAKKTVGG